MNSKFFSQIGLGGLDIGYLFLGIICALLILFVVYIIVLVKYVKLKNKYSKFMQGKNAKSLESEIIGVCQDIKLLKGTADRNKKDIRILYKNMESAIQKTGIVKYDAFNQMGGQLSFSLALLDENNNGFILNSVHSAEGCYSYTKEIIGGKCAIDLGEEEKQALALAMKSEE
ncbi:MAG: DUF4446 family protein [Lachnospiraceae bacterium]|jgi:hypothetical protein|nr:DUF4446 family protein [Lachnospiraceae bacterium]